MFSFAQISLKFSINTKNRIKIKIELFENWSLVKLKISKLSKLKA